MECKELLTLLEEWMDGELAGKRSGEVEEHLKFCTDCQAILEEGRRERALYARFNQTRPGFDPAPALWEGIRKEWRGEESAWKEPRWTRWVQSARQALTLPRLSPSLALVLIGLAIGLTMFWMRGFPPSREKGTEAARNLVPATQPSEGISLKAPSVAKKVPSGESIVTPEGGTGVSTSVAKLSPAQRSKPPLTPRELIRRAERDYLAAIAMIESDLRKRPVPLAPPVEEQFKQALASIDHTILETRKALRGVTEDPVAAHYLLAAYAKKVELLEEMATY